MLLFARADLAATDEPTAAHSDGVVLIADAVAQRLGLSGEQRELLRAAAAMHDIGKISVGAQILNKPGALDEREWAIVHRHTVEGERMLYAMPGMHDVAVLVRHAHERFDGTGYPDGLAGEQIPLLSRIVFCADAYDAIRSDRPYRAGRPRAEALAEVRAGAGSQFDPRVVQALHDAECRRRMTPPQRPVVWLALLLCLVSAGAGSAWVVDGEPARSSAEDPELSSPSPRADEQRAQRGRWLSPPRPVLPRPPAKRRDRSAAPSPSPSPSSSTGRRDPAQDPPPSTRSASRALDRRVRSAPDRYVAAGPRQPRDDVADVRPPTLPTDPQARRELVVAVTIDHLLRHPRSAEQQRRDRQKLAFVVALAKLAERRRASAPAPG